ncbi:MAG: NAD-dependent isocitrate dehydrogenase [Deltaproteobacteria bacterium]|nr:NAD-dependent isocitrate dehydrogenase [Deltaproteobacteria bacterium]
MSKEETPTVTLIRGDGIGPEIAQATLRVLDGAGARLRWEDMPAGMSAVEMDKDPLPPRTLESIKENRVALKGPLATPIGGGFRSVNVALRQALDLYANVRPARTLEGVPTRYQNVDLVVVRENTEDLYAGVEHYVDLRRNAAESIAIITRFGSTRIAEYAYELARTQGRKKVTIVHKANILKLSNGLFLECAREVAKKHPEIQTEEMIVDACAMKLVVDPTKFDVIVTMNLFGDILSDLTAGLVGGLGVAPAANIGADGAIFEAVHGSAPDIAGKGLANPTALMLSAAMMLDYLRQEQAAARLRRGVLEALKNPESRTRDLGGRATTGQFADAVLRSM